jgi:hypothetical protein
MAKFELLIHRNRNWHQLAEKHSQLEFLKLKM